MDWCVNFPRESYIVYRPSLRKACGDNRNAAKFLSYLLFRASIRQEASSEAKYLNEVRKQQGLQPDQDDSITILRTQKQVIQEMDHEISDRTLRDEAIPCLVELGYLKVEPTGTKEQYTAYTVNPVKIQEGINHPQDVPHFKTMQYYQELCARKQEKLEQKNEGSEKTPNGNFSEPERKFFRTGTEIFPNRELEGVGNFSEPKNASDGASQADLEGDSSDPRLLESNKRKKERKTSHSSTLSSQSFSQDDEPEIVLTEEGQQVYGYACQTMFQAKPPKVTPKFKEECEEIAKHIKTLEQFQSLLQFVRALPYIKGQIHLKNLVNELNGWLQVNKPSTHEKSVLGVSGLPLCMSDPSEPRLVYTYVPNKSRRRRVAVQ